MKKTTFITSFFSLFLFGSALAQDGKFEYKPRLKEYEFVGQIGDSAFSLKTPVINNLTNRVFESKLAYPIIFIHGLNSSSETWNDSTDYLDSQYSYVYGGRFDFCLNADGNNITTNKNFYPAAGADIAAFESTVINGDYYYVNFNVKVDGSFNTNVLSNQSAIAKQGAAVKKAVERVLQLTGKDKVILVGHSMGGLASREYIQNPSNWQADNKHHVAKLLTIGTPHGGSNASDNALAALIGTDVSSEAIRDLKTSYYYSGEAGRFLFGGTEIQNSSNMNDNSYTPDFYNVDINCNGITGETILGLNQKPIDHLIDFSSVIGRITNAFGSNITTDGVVAEPSSKMDTFLTGLTYPTKIFYFNSGWDLIENHTELPGYYYQLMQGLDEPNVKELAYGIATNKIYNGYTSIQTTPANPDNDYYKFTVADNVSANVLISNIATTSMNATILDNSGTAVGAVQNNSGATLNFTRNLTPGDYFLKVVSSIPNPNTGATNSTFVTPQYQFTITSTLSASEQLIAAFKFYPNPVKDILHLDNLNLSKATIYSVLGQQLDIKSFESSMTSNTIDMSGYSKGMYIIVLENEGQQQTIKVIKE